MVNNSWLSTPRVSPTLSTTSSVRPRVFINQPRASASRPGTPLARATAHTPRNLPATAVATTRAVASQSAGVSRLPSCVFRPLMAKNKGSSSRNTTVSRRNSSHWRIASSRGIARPQRKAPKIRCTPITSVTSPLSRAPRSNRVCRSS